MNKYLIKDIDVDINLECDDDIYYPTEIFKDTYIDADSPKQAFIEFVKKLEDDCDADCYTHDGFAELTFSVTEVHNMTPEEF